MKAIPQEDSPAKKLFETIKITGYEESAVQIKTTRKRKEKYEVGRSLSQERKVIRSNSEERPALKNSNKNNSFRRVLSSEDFIKFEGKCRGKSMSGRSSNFGHNSKADCFKICAYDDSEHERKRSYERFCRPVMPRGRKVYSTKKIKPKVLSKAKLQSEITSDSIIKSNKIRNDCANVNATSKEKSFVDFKQHLKDKQFLHIDTENEATSPVHSAASTPLNIDLTILHQQVEYTEPLLSLVNTKVSDEQDETCEPPAVSNQVFISPRNSITEGNHRIYLEKIIPQPKFTLYNNQSNNPFFQRVQKLSKQLNSIKLGIKKLECEFESKNGYKPSHADKANDANIKKMYTTLNKTKKEYKQLLNLSLPSPTPKENVVRQDSSEVTLKDTLEEINKMLKQKRESVERSDNVEEMTSAELLEEKIAIQKSLLYLESVHGRPNDKEKRDMLRPLYDRYRSLKLLVNKISSDNTSVIELGTIQEDEAISFSDQSSKYNKTNETVSTSTKSSDSETDTLSNENVQSLSQSELKELIKTITEKKKLLKKKIKEFEGSLTVKGGKIQKEDKLPMEGVYLSYKKLKAKLKLLDALYQKK